MKSALLTAALLTAIGTDALAATISGTVRTRGGAAVAAATVHIHNSAGAVYALTSADGLGNYSFSVAAGTYYVRTYHVQNFIDQLYLNMVCEGDCVVTNGYAITVTAVTVITGVDFALDVGGGISGTVKNATTNAVVPNFAVQLYSSGGSLSTSVNTNASGLYTFSWLAPGPHYVRTAGSATLINQLYNGVMCISCNVTSSGGTSVMVNAGSTTTGINFNLAVGGRISGTVTNASGGAPIQNVSAEIYNSPGAFLASYNSDASGNYITDGLPAGTCYVRTSNSQDFADELFDNLSCEPSCTVTSGTPVGVNTNQTAPGINFGLSPAVSITVTTNPAGRSITVDGVTNTAPQSFVWAVDSSHTIGTSSPQGSGATRYVFTGWSDLGAMSHNVTAPATATTYTANFGTQYLLVTALSPPGAGSIAANPISADAFYATGTVVELTATPNGHSTFSHWTGDLTGSMNPQSVTMNAPRSVTAFFDSFTDDPLTPGETFIKAVHITELRSRIDAARAAKGLGAYSYTDTTTTPGVMPVKAQHILDLRQALAEVYEAAMLTPPSYTDPNLAAGTMIEAVHVEQIRAALIAIQ